MAEFVNNIVLHETWMREDALAAFRKDCRNADQKRQLDFPGDRAICKLAA